MVDLVAARAQPARQLVGAPAAAAADRRKRVGGDQDLHRSRRSCPRSAPALMADRLERAQCAAQLYSRTARSRAAAPSRRAARGSVSRSSAAASARRTAGSYSTPSRSCRPASGCDRPPARPPAGPRHVLEDLQRRPVEAERQRRVRADVERRDADVGGGETRRHRVVRHRAGEDDVAEARAASAARAAARGRRRSNTAPMSVPSARVRARASRARGESRRASSGTRRRRPRRVAGRPRERQRSRGAGRNRSVSAPHSSSTIFRARRIPAAGSPRSA